MQLHDTLQLGRLTSPGRFTLQGTAAHIGYLVVGAEADLELTGDLTLQRLQAKTSLLRAGSASQLADLAIDGDLLVRVAQDMWLQRAVVSGHADLQHTGAQGTLRFGSLDVGRTLNMQGAGHWQGDSALAQGDVSADLGSGTFGRVESASGALRLNAGGHLAVDELHSRLQLIDLSAGSAQLGRVSAAGELKAHTQGDLSVLEGRSGGDMSLTTASGHLGHIRFGTAMDPNDPAGLLAAHLKTTGNLLVHADGDVLGGNAEADLELRMIGRNLRFGRAQSLKEDIFLQANGNFLQGHGNITGQVVEAKRDVGIIANGDLSMPKVLFGGTYSLKAGRDLVVGLGGDLNITGIAEAGRDLRFEIAGKVDLEGVRAGRNLSIVAGETINIEQFIDAGGHITLKANQGDIRIGQRIRSSSQYQGQVIAGNILLSASGSIETPLVESLNGRIDAEGARLQLGDLASSQRIDLLSRGLIRVATSRSAGDQRWTADEGIFFERLLANGQALLDGLLDVRGTELRAEQGALVRAGIRQGGSHAASIHLQQAEAPSLSLWAGNLVRVADAAIGQRLDLHGRDIQLYGRHTGSGQLDLWVQGSAEQQIADTLLLRLDAASIAAPRLYVADALIDTTAAQVDLRDARGVNRLELRTPQARVRMDNASPVYMADADVQLYELDKAFSLKQSSLLSDTSAYVLHRKLTHQVVVPNFSINREASTGVPYQGISAARFAEQHLSSGLTLVRLSSLLNSLAAAVVPSSVWVPAWSQAPVETRINIDVADERLEGDEVASWSL
ncbi:hypothetical protein [Pseudomonas peli]|uniref:hypothetical protein n=1 Tax=Pseudomonas peli TaxID=592361 RepID=UPI0024ADC279|nr:hypothetical protein [Pseudomonas peli]